MKTRLLLVVALLLLAGCAHPDGRREAAATQSAIGRTAAAVTQADAANSRALAHTAAARSLDQQVYNEAQRLLSSK